jgi:feruloyl esterase
MNNLMSWSGNFFISTGPPESPSFVSQNMWATTIQKDVLDQCDSLDGLVDGLIEDPSLCHYDPSRLLCNGTATKSTSCLTAAQIETVRKIYSPLVYSDGDVVYPRM